jgi:hypothetical protein
VAHVAALPDIVVAPAHPDIREGGKDVVFEVRNGADGGQVLPVFSTVRLLVEVLGPAQPWVALPLESARALAASRGVDRVVLDPVAEPGAWRWHPEDLDTWRRSNG